MLTLVLADAELERVPKALTSHPSVRKPAKRRNLDPSRVILDASMHHAAMHDHELTQADRRGRPDLTHLALLTALDATLNLEGGLETVVHTRHDERIRVAHDTRLVRAYPRFKGLMSALFDRGVVGPDGRDPLLSLERGVDLATTVADLDVDHVIALDPAGERVEPAEHLPPIAREHDDVAVVLGAFPKGDYRSPVGTVADEVVSIHPRALSVWTAASEVLVHWRWCTRGMDVHRGEPPELPGT